MNSVVMIDAGGATTRTLPKDVQFHPVTDRPLHVDFLRISEHATVTVAVPINFIDEEKSKGLKRGGVLNTVRHELELVCDAAEIPEEIAIDLAGTRHRRFDAHSARSPCPRASRARSPTATSPSPRSSRRPASRSEAEDAAAEAAGEAEPARPKCRPSARPRRKPRAARNNPWPFAGWPPSSRPGASRCMASRRTPPYRSDWGDFAPVQIWVGLGNPGAKYAMHRHNVGFMALDAIAEVHGFEPPKKAFSGWAQQGRIGRDAHPAAEARHLS